jgi:type VI secretion system protein
MAREQALLERMKRRDQEVRNTYQPTAVEDIDALMESVRAHLIRLLNARHGMCECLSDYGLPALSDLIIGVGDHVQTVLNAIKATVETYEPRLRRVRVTRVVDEDEEHDRGHTLSFRVDAVLVSKTGEHRVWYETSLNGNGQFDVEG